MSLSTTFSAPFFTGASSSTEVPGRFHCSLAGRPYMIDTARLSEFRRQGIPLLKEQQDTSGVLGENSLSGDELWRRSQDDWTHGAGQTFLDRQDSDPKRFRSSKGIDVWTKWQMTLLPDTTKVRNSANSNLFALPVGGYVYMLDGGALVRTADLSAFTTITGVPATAATSMTTDGYTVWTAHGADGVYSTARGTASTASYATGMVSAVGYAKGRLMAAAGPALYNITAAGALPTALFTHPNTDWSWVGFADGQAAIYAAGYSGDKSLVYRITIKQDGTGLDVPLVAGELPDGEIVRAIHGYLGYLVLGTDLGVRFCATDGEGNLTVGALIRADEPVRCFEGQDRFVWFGWSNYDSTSTGLGRLDLSVFASPLTPAYASDLMATAQGTVRSIATFDGKRIFTVDGQGLYAQSEDFVAEGHLDTGLISFGLPDLKTAVYLDVKVAEAVDSNAGYVAVDGGAFIPVGLRTTSLTDPFTVGEMSGEHFEVRHVLLNDSPLGTAPVVTRWTLRAFPRPSQGEIFLVPLLLHENVQTSNDGEWLQQPLEEFNVIAALRESKRLVTFQLANQSYTVQVDDAMFQFSHTTESGQSWNGTALVRLKSYSE